MIRREIDKILKILICVSFITLQNISAQNIESKPIVEHMGDRFSINVDNMELSGDESLLDVLQMIPDFIMKGYYNVADHYSVRINNIPLNLDVKTFLELTKAKEVQKLQVCNYPNVVKGTDGLDGVIDVYYHHKESELNGVANLELQSDGRARTVIEALYSKNKFTWWCRGQGNIIDDYLTVVKDYGKTYQSMNNIYDNVKVGVNYAFSENNNLLFNVYKRYSKDQLKEDAIYVSGSETDIYDKSIKSSFYGAMLDYVRIFDNSSKLAFEAIVDYERSPYTISRDHSNSNPMANIIHGRIENTKRLKSLYPHAYLDYSMPFFDKTTWVTFGTDVGYKSSDRCLDFNSEVDEVSKMSHFDFNEKYMYEDIYAQVDFKYGTFGVTLGDRFKWLQYKSDLGVRSNWSYVITPSGNVVENMNGNTDMQSDAQDNRSANTFLASAYWNIDASNTVKATYARRLYTPQNADIIHFQYEDTGSELKYSPKKVFYSTTPIVDIIDVNYTLQAEKTTVMLDMIHRDGTTYGVRLTEFGAQASMYGNFGNFRMMFGTEMYRVKYSQLGSMTMASGARYNLKLVPMVTLPKSWLVQTTCIYTSKAKFATFLDEDEQFYASVRCSKTFNRHWNVYCEWHDLMNYELHKRALTLGGSYVF